MSKGTQPDATPETTNRKVPLPRHLVERVEGRLDGNHFETPETYIAFVLKETLARVEADDDSPRTEPDTDIVEERLGSLGYLDQ